MPKQCPDCGMENPENEFWCRNCKSRLVRTISIQKDEHPSESLNKGHKVSQRPYFDERKTRPYGFKIFICIVAGLVLTTLIITYVSLSIGSDFKGINCRINEDFWFEGNYLNSSDGWTFIITKVKDYTLDGLVLGLKTYDKNDYPYNPINIFSPIDLVIGIDDVKDNPDKYPYALTYFYRGYWVTFQGGNAADSEYMKTHMGNNHIIPHNEEVLNELQNISINDKVVIEGSLVNLYGTRGNQNYHWNTDTRIGNYDCEIILVDMISITSQ
ncbi:MAG: hypothetical protein ACOC80_09505 [Petrotogales bacterium]